ncbi:MAG: hypothetical protein B7Z37_22560 [Verrucomicrobia bacterium 12-59-8]|nr:MAG: hypothetical protein B7Z37_22560 [Verrucomicrobia bacterium 12-59-8]
MFAPAFGRLHHLHLAAFLLVLGCAGSLQAGFSTYWALGVNDGSANEFVSESYNSNAAPGSATQKDDDYYFAGTYPAPIGVVAVSENPATNFERAITTSDPNDRLHFMLSAEQASSTGRYRLTFHLIWGGWWLPEQGTGGKGYGRHDVVVKMNGVVVGTKTFAHDDGWVLNFNASQVGAVAGENVLEISRVGGSTDAWIAFDDVAFEVNPTALVDADNDGMPQYWEDEQGLSDSDATDAAKDNDHDGLTALQEYPVGTDPNDADTDEDGLKDGEEASTFHTNALLADTDGDGVLDGEEGKIYHSNPLLVDTDDDGAPDGWEIRTGYDASAAASKPPPFPYAIGFHFATDQNANNVIKPLEVTGYAPQMDWNETRLMTPWGGVNGDVSDVASPALGKLVDSSGADTNVNIAWTASGMWYTGNNGSSNQRLMNTFLNVGDDTPVSVTLSNISFSQYDVIAYVGSYTDGNHGYLRLNDDAATDRHFLANSTRPQSEFIEPGLSSESRPWRGNVLRFRNLTGSTFNIKLYRYGNDAVGLHAIQIVHATADTDADGMPDWWELRYKLRPDAAADASLDPDMDGATNSQEYLAGTDARKADTDGDGLTDGEEIHTYHSNPLLTDTDGDGLTDGDEVKLYHTSPLLGDADGDGRTDAEELRMGSDPAAAEAATYLMPVITTTPRSFDWSLNNVQLVWDHGQGQTAVGGWEDILFTAAVTNSAAAGEDSLRVGLRCTGNRVTRYLYSGVAGAFSYSNNPTWDIWDTDWNWYVQDLKAALGFSGYGKVDISQRLRFRVYGTNAGNDPNAWTMIFEIRNLDTNQVVDSVTFTNCTLAPSAHNGTATWQNHADPAVANRLSIDTRPGVQLFFRPAALTDTTAFAAYRDTGKDGIPDAWQDAHGLNKNDAADAGLDPDSDGVTNLQEYLLGTDPHNADTDNDTVPDGVEVAAGSDPLNPLSKPPFFSGLPAGINGVDLNGNGIADAYEQWSGSFNLQSWRDSDGDGYTDAQEATAGTNPLDPKSHPWLSFLQSGNDFTLRWGLAANKQHQVWQSTDLQNWAPASGTPSPMANEMRQTFANVLGGSRKFYKVAMNDVDTDGDGVSDWLETNVMHSDPTSANSLHAPVAVRTMAGGSPVTTTISGDYYAYIERYQGGTVNGGFASSDNGGSTGSGISRANAARFLTQATFGPIPQDIERLQGLGYAAWLTEQMSKAPTLHSTYIERIFDDVQGAHTDPLYNTNDSRLLFGNNMMSAFARAAVQGDDQLRQRVAFALSQILVASRRDANLTEKPLGMASFYDIFVKNAFGNYYDVLWNVTLHPCMGRYLSHVGNQKARPEINQYPDENFAREVMQLFSIGLWELNPDGSRKVDANDKNIPTYTNTEITQTARAMTGLWFGGREWGNGGWTDPDYSTPMTMHAEYHDFAPKTLVRGLVLPQRPMTDEDGMKDVAEAVRNLFNHPNCPPFICKQLIQFLVTDNPSPAYVQRVSSKFTNNGSGVRGDLAAVVRAILLDDEARDPRYSENVTSHGKLKEPVVRTMGLARAFGIRDVANFVWWDWGDFYESSRQEPTNSPSVFNFYRPEYRAAGLLTQNNLAGPVFQITDSYSSIAMPNKLWSIIDDGFHMSGVYHFPLDYSWAATLSGTPELLVDELNMLFCGGRMSATTRAIILNAINQIPADQATARAKVAVYLTIVSPEGAVIK